MGKMVGKLACCAATAFVALTVYIVVKEQLAAQQ